MAILGVCAIMACHARRGVTKPGYVANRDAALAMFEKMKGIELLRKLVRTVDCHAAFKQLDSNGDGYLSQSELVAGISFLDEATAILLMGVLDSDRDGRVSYGEVIELAAVLAQVDELRHDLCSHR